MPAASPWAWGSRRSSLLAAAGAIDLDTAFTVARWTGLALIGFYGYCAARLAGGSLVRGLVHAFVIAFVGAMLIALKALVH